MDSEDLCINAGTPRDPRDREVADGVSSREVPQAIDQKGRQLREAGVSAELVALRAAALELAAGRAANLVDRARVGARRRAQMHARAIAAGRECQLAEVARLQLRDEVIAPESSPAK